MTVFLHDAYRFVLANRHIADIAPLQLYSSSIVFAPQESLVRKICGQIPAWIKHNSVAPRQWSLELQTLEGHESAVPIVVFSHDGRMLVSKSEGRSLKIWNPTTGQLLQSYDYFDSPVTALCFSPDDKHLSVADKKRGLMILDVGTGQISQNFCGNFEHIGDAMYSEGRSLLAIAVASPDCAAVLLLDTSTGETIQSFPIRSSPETISDYILAFSDDDTMLCGSNGESAVVWNLPMRQIVHSKLLGTDHDKVTGASFLPKSTSVTFHCSSGATLVWDMTTGQLSLEPEQRKPMTMSRVVVSSDGKLHATFSFIGTIYISDAETGQSLAELRGHTAMIIDVEFSPSSVLLAVGSSDGTITIWELKDIRETEPVMDNQEVQLIDFAFHADGSLLVATKACDALRITNSNNGQEILSLPIDGELETARFSPSGKWFLLETQTGEVKLLQIFNKAEQRDEECGEKRTSVASSTEVELLIPEFMHRDLRIWEVCNEQFQSQIDYSLERVATAISDNGNLLAYYHDCEVNLQDLVTGQIKCISNLGGAVLSLAFSHGGNLLAMGDHHNSLEIWDHVLDQRMQTFAGLDSVGFVSFSTDDTVIRTQSNAVAVDQRHHTSIDSEHEVVGVIELEDGWIWQDGMRLLWLPHKYRTKRWAFHDDKLAVARGSAEVGMLQIDSSKMDFPRVRVDPTLRASARSIELKHDDEEPTHKHVGLGMLYMLHQGR